MLAVTGIGMVSPLGFDAVSSCAAARAGIRGVVDLDAFHVFDDQAEAEVPLAVHMIPKISNGLFGIGRLLQIALVAIDDLRRTSSGPTDRPIGMILVLRSDCHRAAWIERVRSSPELATSLDFDVEAAEVELAADRKRLAENLLGQIVRLGDVRVASRATRVVLADQSGFVAALEQARVWLQDGTCEKCWIGGVDSYLDPPVLEALDGLGLLRTPDRSVGLMPGELACFIALEDDRRVVAGGRQPLGVIDAFAREEGSAHRTTDGPRTADPLVRVLASVEKERASDLLVVNLNGDPVRASEWAHAQVRRLAMGVQDRAPSWLPPLYFGEIGAATGPASVALLTHGWARRYALPSMATVGMIEDGCARSAFSMFPPRRAP
jgi:3-oxoacyl-[acyl-carrier-protein] synthase-1